MAKTSSIEKNERRKKTVARYAEKRLALKATLANPQASEDEKDAARIAIQQLPRDANPIRIRRRCVVSGRPRAVYKKFGLSRVALREMALKGQIPGMTKSSW